MSCRVCEGEKLFLHGAISGISDYIVVSVALNPETGLMELTAQVNDEEELIDEWDPRCCPECGEELR